MHHYDTMAVSGYVKSISLPVLLVALIFLYNVFKVVYRLFFHPLAKIPGPWYAAVSSLYEFYWDCIQSGRYYQRIEGMHDKYGPIVRINPWEVHIKDSSFVDMLWANSKMEKEPRYYRGLGTDNAVVVTESANVHRRRRGAMATFFSKANVAKLEPKVLARVQQLCGRIEEFRAQDRPICVSDAFRCLALDVVTDYAVPKTENLLADPDFGSAWVRVMRDTACLVTWNRHFPFILPLVNNIPRRVVAALDRDGTTTGIVDRQRSIWDQAKAAIENKNSKPTQTVVNAIFEHPSLPPQEKTLRRIFDETSTIIGGGTETAGATLAHLTFHVLSNPRIIATLKAELNQAAFDNNIPRDSFLDFHLVEQLPYLQAVMKEALRHSCPVMGRMPRRNPHSVLTYATPSGKTYVLPPGTTASMSVPDIHFDAAIFPNPHEFQPERWLVSDPIQLAHLEKHMVAFGKGVRACLGLELAKQEMLLVAGNLFWKYDFELFETTAWDVAIVHDFVAPFGPSESKGVRVKVKG